MRRLLLLGISLFIYLYATGQNRLLTKAESSDFKSTSDYLDVINFIDILARGSELIRVESIGKSVEGRDIPLLVIGDPVPASPADLLNDHRVIVYIQGNIHAGEVEGKEAALMFARDILEKKGQNILKHAVILICPFINPDGNEKISPANRTHQEGPVNGVGVRHNSQFLDINRDGMKAETPEMRGLLRNVFNKWDPAVFMDCHTTNGSYHVEPVTFTWGVNPAGDTSIIHYMRDRMMPEMSSVLAQKYKVENCFYGEFVDMLDPDKGWILDVPEPRYLSNYFGLRNRLGILNENYVYADYRSRVMGCYYLMYTLLDYVSAHGKEIKDIIRQADAKLIARGESPARTDSFGIRFDVRQTPEKVLVKTYEAELVSVTDGYKNYRKTDRRKDVLVPYYADWFPVKSVRLPYAYLLTVPDPDVLDLLKAHGIIIERLASPEKLEVESFTISALNPSVRLNQGHYTNSISGSYEAKTIEFPEGTFIIRTAQLLGNVASYLLEPESADGLVTWNFLDKYLVPQWGSGYNAFPVYRLTEKRDIRVTVF